MLKRLAALTLATTLVGCGDAPDTAETPQTPPSSELAADPLAPPGSAAATGASEPAPEVVIPQREPGVFASGDLAARTETAALSVTRRDRNGDGGIRLGLALTLANVGSEPFSIVMTEGGTPSFMLENGLVLGEGSNLRWDMTGLMQCRYPTDECRIRQPQNYVEIAPGESMTANITLNGRFDAAQAASLSGLTRGNLTMRLHLIQGDTISRTINLTMPNMPIQNGVTN